MCIAIRAETKAAVLESRLEYRAEDLVECLLPHPVHDGGNTQQPFLAVGFWDVDTLDWSGLITSRSDLLLHRVAVQLEVRL